MGSSESKTSKAARKQAESAWNKYSADYDLFKNQYGQERQQANAALQQDFGKNGTDFFNKANQAGTEFANQQLGNAAKASAAASQNAARASGMGKGQAALMSAGKVNQLYDNNFMGAQGQGAERYQTSARDYQGQMQNRQANSMGQMGLASGAAQAATDSLAGNQQMSDWDRGWGVASGVGGIISGVGGIVGSDRRMKVAQKETIDYSPYLERIKKLMEAS
jgi:hypothetical protein